MSTSAKLSKIILPLVLLLFTFIYYLNYDSNKQSVNSITSTDAVTEGNSNISSSDVSGKSHTVVRDVFQDYLEKQKTISSKQADVRPEKSKTAVTEPIDPFKVFLDNQKLNRKEQVVSPFEKVN